MGPLNWESEDPAKFEDTAEHSLNPTRPAGEAVSAKSSTRLLSETGTTTDSQPSQHPKPLETPKSLFAARPSPSDFKFQFVACAVSVTSLTSLVVVAFLYRDRPDSDWPSDTISINAVVAALTTALKGSLTTIVASSISQAKWSRFMPPTKAAAQLRELDHIDQASRGPWGSVTFMLHHPFQMSLISLGAVITIAALALDISSQQIVSIKTRMVADPSGRARVPWVQTANGTMSNAQAAFYDGFFGDELEDVPVVCSSGNCTWDKIPTIGVCGACFDAPSRLQVNCSEVTLPAGGTSLTLCNYTTSKDSRNPSMQEPTILNTIAPNALIKDYKKGYTSNPVPLTVSHIGPGSSRELCERLNFTDPAFEDLTQAVPGICSGAFEVIELALDTMTPQDEYMPLGQYWPPSGRFGSPQASLCGFWECLQEITINVSNGKQSEHIETSPESHHQITHDTISQPLQPFTEHLKFNMKGRNFSSDDIGRFNIPLLETASETTSNSSRLTTYRHNSLMERWNATRSNRSEWIERIAASLTKALRLSYQLPEDQEDPYAGTAFILEVYFEVRWPWVLYPAFAVVAGLVLFALNVRETLEKRRAVWSDSMLVPLLIDVDEDLRDAARGSSRASSAALNTAVGDRKVLIELRDDVWVLRRE